MKTLLFIILFATSIMADAACKISTEYLVTFGTTEWMVSGVVKNQPHPTAPNQSTSKFQVDYVNLIPTFQDIKVYTGTGDVSIDPITCVLSGGLTVDTYTIPYRVHLNKQLGGVLIGSVESAYTGKKTGVVGRIEHLK